MKKYSDKTVNRILAECKEGEQLLFTNGSFDSGMKEVVGLTVKDSIPYVIADHYQDGRKEYDARFLWFWSGSKFVKKMINRKLDNKYFNRITE